MEEGAGLLELHLPFFFWVGGGWGILVGGNCCWVAIHGSDCVEIC